MQKDLDKRKNTDTITRLDALELVNDYLVNEAYHDFALLNAALVAEDDERRYITQTNILVKTPDGASVCTFVMRPRAADDPLPAQPALLGDKVNYEVTGANVWKHAPSLEAMSPSSMRFYLSPAQSGGAHHLSQTPSDGVAAKLKVNFADRSDVDRDAVGGGVIDDAVDTHNAVEFVSDPLPRAVEISGLFSGHMDFIANKRDFDFKIDLYELTPQGKYVQLGEYWTRASYINVPGCGAQSDQGAGAADQLWNRQGRQRRDDSGRGGAARNSMVRRQHIDSALVKISSSNFRMFGPSKPSENIEPPETTNLW